MANIYASKDEELYKTWKANPTKENLGKLVEVLMPIAGKEIMRSSGTLPQSALTGEAKKWLVQAIKTYKEGKGASIGTHATNYLQKIRRLNYTYQNVARLPESQQLKYSTYQGAISNLTYDLGRQPTDEEIAKSLGWSKKQVVNFDKMIFKDWGEDVSGVDSTHFSYDTKPMFLSELKSTLEPNEKALMELLLQEKKLSNTELSKRLKVSIPTLSLLKARIKKKADKLQYLL